MAVCRRFDYADQPVDRTTGRYERQPDAAAGVVGDFGFRWPVDLGLCFCTDLLPQQLHHSDRIAGTPVQGRQHTHRDFGAVSVGQYPDLPSRCALFGQSVFEIDVRCRLVADLVCRTHGDYRCHLHHHRRLTRSCGYGHLFRHRRAGDCVFGGHIGTGCGRL